MRQEYTSIEEMSFTLAGTPQIFWYDDLSIEKPIIFLYFSEIPKIFFFIETKILSLRYLIFSERPPIRKYIYKHVLYGSLEYLIQTDQSRHFEMLFPKNKDSTERL